MGNGSPAEVEFGLWYDLRNPPATGRPAERLYAEVLEQIVAAEASGFDAAWVSEHHFCDDGYLPSPLVFLAAVAARTSRLHLGTNLMVASLHDPVRLAEDAALLSILSDGRFDLGVSVGYREEEFTAFGRSLRNRPSLIEEAIEILRRAWAGESIAFEGKRFRYPDVRVTPRPARAPRILIGANSAPARARAARIGDGFLSPDNAAIPLYLEALEDHGRSRDEGRVTAIQFVVVDEDPERTWARVGGLALEQINTYIGWGAFGPAAEVPRFESPAALLDAGAYRLWDGPTAVAELTALVETHPQVEGVHWPTLLPGEPVSDGSVRLEFAAREVLPAVRRRLAEAEARS
jgi:alkanesulfonate monooxygenase SsuD/methylene tetrahydromethanopterin reductase-like flavin-dependent oxidoreductase (luciferase family)